RRRGDGFADRLDERWIDARDDLGHRSVRPTLVVLPDPVHRGLGVAGHARADLCQRRFELLTEVVMQCLAIGPGYGAALEDALLVELSHRGVLANELVHHRLGERGLIALVVTET